MGPPPACALGTFWRAFRRDREGVIGLGSCCIVVAGRGLRAAAGRPQLGYPSPAAPGKPIQRADLDTYWLGTDNNGRPVLTLIIWGSRISLFVGLAATLISMVLGTLLGIFAGHFAGLLGGVFNKLTDWFLVIPFLPLAIALAIGLPQRSRGCSR